MAYAFAALLVMLLLGYAYLISAQNGRIVTRLDAIERDILVARLRADAPVSRDAGTSSSPPSGGKVLRDGIPVGTAAPHFSVARLDGSGRLSLTDYANREFLLTFVSADCGPCEVLFQRLSQLPAGPLSGTIAIVARGSVDAVRAKCRLASSLPVGRQDGWEVSKDYGTFKMPSAFVVGADGRVAAGPLLGPDAIAGAACDLVFRNSLESILGPNPAPTLEAGYARTV